MLPKARQPAHSCLKSRDLPVLLKDLIASSDESLCCRHSSSSFINPETVILSSVCFLILKKKSFLDSVCFIFLVNKELLG